MKKHPPIWTDKLIDWIIKEDLQEEIRGDLYEHFYELQRSKSRFKSIRYSYQLLQFFRPFALKIPFKNSILGTMIRFNLIVAFRNLKKNRVFSFINVLGLALGMLVCMLIGTYVLDELSYDTHWKNASRVYRVAADLNFDGNMHQMATSPGPMAAAFKSEFPEIIKSGRFRNIDKQIIEVENRFFPIDDIAYADQESLDIFQFEISDGSVQEALTEPGFAMLDEGTSKKLFNTTKSVGKTFKMYDQSYVVKAVYEDIPENSHFHFEIMLSMKNDAMAANPIWLSNNYRTYFLIDEENNPAALEEKFPSVYKKYFGPQLLNFANVSWEEFEESNSVIRYYLQPLEEIHLSSHLNYEMESNGNMQYVYILIIAGAFVLVIACINFMNISTAQSSTRAREVGMKKVLGSHRNQLIIQFLMESLLLSLIALIIASALTFVFLPYMNALTGKDISDPFFGRIGLWPYALLASVAMGFLAGIYPAFFLSSFKPLKILKGQLSMGLKGVKVRNVLVIVQFVASIMLIFCTMVIYSQLNFYQKKSLGFDKEQVLIVEESHTMGEKINAFREELAQHNLVQNVSLSSYLPTINGSRSDSPMQPKGSSGAENSVSMQNWRVDEHYIETMGLEIVEGRNFDKGLSTDSAALIINESAAKRFGFENPIGQRVQLIGDFAIGGLNEFKIVGIVKDFHFEDFKVNITPLSLLYLPSSGYTLIKYQSGKTDAVLAFAEQKWKEFNPGYPFIYSFLDQQFDAHYQSEEKLSKLFTAFAVFSIIIACLGLFGLASYAMDQRRKEIGVRKVLGASTFVIVRQQILDYSKLLVISMIIGLPLGGFLMNKWLENFSYRTVIDLFTYLTPALIIIFIAWLVVSVISYRASSKSPVTNLNRD